MSKERGCGKRKEGGVYAEAGGSGSGAPLESFVLCPPSPIDADALGISPVGVQIRQLGDDTWHVIDWVGKEYYPSVADFLEEVRRLGLSRRLPKTLDFAKLTPESRIVLLHERAMISNPIPFQEDRFGGKKLGLLWEKCPRGRVHEKGEMCAGLWWEDVLQVDHHADSNRLGMREMPSFKYHAASAPNGKHSRSLAVFATFPIERLALIRAQDGSHNETAKLVSKSSIPLEVLDE